MLFLPTDTKLLSTQFTRASSAAKRRNTVKQNTISGASCYSTTLSNKNQFRSGNKKNLLLSGVAGKISTNNAYFGIKKGSEEARNLITYMGNIQ